jgi:peroxiredoxin
MKFSKSVYIAAAGMAVGLAMIILAPADGPAQATQPAANPDAMALVGKPAPDFKIPGLDGATHSLADVKGSVVILDFWGVWCVPCHLALPHLDALYQKDSAQGLKVLAIDNGDEKDRVQQFVTQSKLTLPVLLDPDSAAANAYKVDEYPQTVVIGKDGVIKNIFIGFNEKTSPDLLESAVTAAMNDTGTH